MIHHMTLFAEPFEQIASRKKTIELRLNDPKRQLIHPGDLIIFVNQKQPTLKITCRVKQLHYFTTFEELYATLPLTACGYSLEKLQMASPQDMLKYYPLEKQLQYQALGIEIELLDNT